jgi:hypothetical protein
MLWVPCTRWSVSWRFRLKNVHDDDGLRWQREVDSIYRHDPKQRLEVIGEVSPLAASNRNLLLARICRPCTTWKLCGTSGLSAHLYMLQEVQGRTADPVVPKTNASIYFWNCKYPCTSWGETTGEDCGAPKQMHGPWDTREPSWYRWLVIHGGFCSCESPRTTKTRKTANV